MRGAVTVWCAGVCAALSGSLAVAHHAITAKFDDANRLELRGIVTSVDWRNPHVHVFTNVTRENGAIENWAVELESTVLLKRSGWQHDTLRPGDAIDVSGPAARDGSRQVWGESVVEIGDPSPGLQRQRYRAEPPAVAAPDAACRRRQAAARRSRTAPAVTGPIRRARCCMQAGANVQMNGDGVLARLADAPRVAPFQPWALGVYRHRQAAPSCRRSRLPELQSAGCGAAIPDALRRAVRRGPGAPAHLRPVGGGNRNYHIIYMDGRDQQGQVQGDDDNPLYYGRAVAHWEGDTLVVATTGFNEDFWFTNGGLPHTDQLSLVERFSRPDYDTLRYEVTVTDPGAYTQPWSSSWELRWVGGEDLPVYFCQDNRS